MTASNLVSQEKSAVDRKAYEPSMEEILASIRRIIADDQSILAAPSAPPEARQSPVPVAAEEPPKMPRAAAAEPSVHGPAQLQPVPAEAPRWDADIASGQAHASPARSVQEPTAAPRVARQADGFVQVAASPDGRAEETRPPLDQRRRGEALQRSGEMIAETPLVSPATGQTVSGAFNALVASRFVQNQDAMADMIRDMVRPMLKAWLDDNLPIMVERLVRAEIERVARGGR